MTGSSGLEHLSQLRRWFGVFSPVILLLWLAAPRFGSDKHPEMVVPFVTNVEVLDMTYIAMLL